MFGSLPEGSQPTSHSILWTRGHDLNQTGYANNDERGADIEYVLFVSEERCYEIVTHCVLQVQDTRER
jgi:hypothetical protein